MSKKFVTLALALVMAGCLNTPSARAPHPLVLIGIDGLEWRVVVELLNEGKLPTFANLMHAGTYGELESMEPTLSPALWTSIATGTRPREHRIRGFVKTVRRGATSTRLYNNHDRKTKAFWNILSERRRKVHIVGWWMTYPVEEINGVMAAQVNTTTLRQVQAGKGIWKGSLVAGLNDQVHPVERQDEILALVPEAEANSERLEALIFGDIDKQEFPLAARFKALSHWAFRADASYKRIAQALLDDNETGNFDVLSVYFGGADVVAHRFWRYRYPQLYTNPPSAAAIERFGNVIADYYIHLDTVVGELLDTAPADVNVIIVGDHGMHAVNRKGTYAANARDRTVISAAHPHGPPTVLIAAGPDIKTRSGAELPSPLLRENIESVGSILDVTPTMLALQNLVIGSDMAGNVMTGLLREDFFDEYPARYITTHTETDWAVSRASDVDGDVNVKERLEQLRALGYVE